MTKSVSYHSRRRKASNLRSRHSRKSSHLVQLYLAETHLFDSSGMHPSTAPPIWAMVDAHWSGEWCAKCYQTAQTRGCDRGFTHRIFLITFRPTQRSLNPSLHSYSASRHIHSDGLITGYMRLAALHNKPDRPPKFLEARTLSAASLATAFTVEMISTATPTKISDICQCVYASRERENDGLC